MDAERYLPHSFAEYIGDLSDNHPVRWLNNLIKGLEAYLIKEEYDKDDIRIMAFPMLKDYLLLLFDTEIDSLEKPKIYLEYGEGDDGLYEISEFDPSDYDID